MLLTGGLLAWLTPTIDRTFFTKSHGPSEKTQGPAADRTRTTKDIKVIFESGAAELARGKHLATTKPHGARVKYFASQVIGVVKGAKSIGSGAKLLGFLVTTIDTHEPSPVSVVIPNGGVSNSGFEIQKDSVLNGLYSYRGSGDKVTLSFSELSTPDGDLPISAFGLDAADYTTGVRGTVYSDAGLKTVATLGLTMASGMANVLTEREFIGNSVGAVTARPTMKDALMQGTSQAAQNESARVGGEINESKDYVIVPKGTEVIIQLTKVFKKQL